MYQGYGQILLLPVASIDGNGSPQTAPLDAGPRDDIVTSRRVTSIRSSRKRDRGTRALKTKQQRERSNVLISAPFNPATVAQDRAASRSTVRTTIGKIKREEESYARHRGSSRAMGCRALTGTRCRVGEDESRG
jgi:hypothetical protein